MTSQSSREKKLRNKSLLTGESPRRLGIRQNISDSVLGFSYYDSYKRPKGPPIRRQSRDSSTKRQEPKPPGVGRRAPGAAAATAGGKTGTEKRKP